MGLFNKLKNVLFEEEEIEIPANEPPKKEIKKEEKKRSVNVYDEGIKSDNLVTPDNSLFKAEKTFDFPLFDDDEFNEMKTTKEPIEEEPKRNMSINLFDYEKPKIKKEKPITKPTEIRGRAYENKSANFNTRKFKPSPVISPVYGVLDKNYKKEDIIVKQEEKKQIDVDDVRKKAFGTLEDDIEKSLLATSKEEKINEEKTIDELLEETAFDTIDVKDYDEKEIKDEEKVKKEPIELEVLDKKEEKTNEEKLEQEDTLENDLFDLIDSMYENREDE